MDGFLTRHFVSADSPAKPKLFDVLVMRLGIKLDPQIIIPVRAAETERDVMVDLNDVPRANIAISTHNPLVTLRRPMP